MEAGRSKRPALSLRCQRQSPLLAYHHCQTGGLAGGLFAIFVPTHNGSSSDPLEGTAPLNQRQAFQYTTDMIEIAEYLADKHRDKFSLAKMRARSKKRPQRGDSRDFAYRRGRSYQPVIGRAVSAKRAGICSIGPLWSRPNIFGQGVPFSFRAAQIRAVGLPHMARHWSKPVMRQI